MSSLIQTANDHFNALPVWAKAALGTVAAAASAYALLSYNRQRKSPYKADFEKGTVYLYQFSRSPVIPSFSPFCLKLETWLRMTDVKYENVPIPFSIRSKEGTLPFVELDGKEYDDSGFIIRDLSKILKKDHLEANLANEQKAVARSFEQMVENTTIWSYVFVRYCQKWDDFIVNEKVVGKEIAKWAGFPFARWSFQSSIKNRMKSHGIGKHSENEVINIGLDDIRAISAYLGVKRFFLGEQPSRVDAALFGVLAQIVYIPLDTPHKKLIDTDCQNLAKYCDRMKDRFWPDWKEIGETLSLNTKYKK